MAHRLSFLLQHLVVMVVFVGGTVTPLLADPLSSQGEAKEIQPQDQPERLEPTLPRKDLIPPPNPETEPMTPEKGETNRLGNIFPQPMEPGLPPPPMPQPMEPGLPAPPMPQPFKGRDFEGFQVGEVKAGMARRSHHGILGYCDTFQDVGGSLWLANGQSINGRKWSLPTCRT